MRTDRKTSKDYIKEIKEKYEREKNGAFSTYLFNPTPSLLKQLCILKADSLSVDDKTVFNNFFNLNDGTSISRQIDLYDTDKFRPMCKLLKGSTKYINPAGLEIIAVLVDFKNRPLKKFLNSQSSKDVIITKEGNDGLENVTVEIVKKEANSIVTETFNYKPLILVVLIAFIGGLLYFLSLKKCMVWENDHYRKVSCDYITEDINQQVVPLDKEMLYRMRKITVNDTTTFFNKDGSPKIWYGKSFYEEYEFFTSPGFHPETGETLKKITPYIVNKYIRSKKE